LPFIHLILATSLSYVGWLVFHQRSGSRQSVAFRIGLINGGARH